MKYIIGLIIGLIMTAFLAYGENLTYTIAQIQALLDSVNAKVSTSAGVADAGKMVVLDASGMLDASIAAGTGTVTAANTPVDNDFAKFTTGTAIEGRSYAEVKEDLDLEIGTDVLAEQTIGIANNNLLEVDGTPADNEYAKFTANGLEGRTEAEFKGDFNLEAGTDYQAYDAGLQALSGKTPAANKVLYYTGAAASGLLDFFDENDMASDSSTGVPSQSSVKKYVDDAVGAGVADGDKGDVTVSVVGTVWTVDADAITYAKIQNVSATDKVLGRSTAGAGVIEEIAMTAFGRSIIDDLNEAAFKATVNLEIGTDVLAEQTIGIADDNLIEVDGTPLTTEFARFTANGLEGRTPTEVRGDLELRVGQEVLAYQTIGIADDNLLEVDDAAAADNDYAKFTANGLEGQTYAQVRTDLNVADGADVTGSNAPQAHAASHLSAGGDAIKLDDLAAPDDNTDLNVSTSAHGLVPKGTNTGTAFLRDDATWAVPAGGGDVAKVGTPVDNEIGVWTGDGTLEGDTNFQWDGSALKMLGTIYIKEQADAAADVEAYGQIWVNTETPNKLYFTDDAGTDFEIGAGSGDVTVSGVPEALDFARWTDLNTIEGLTYGETRTALGLVIGTNVLAEQTIGIADNNLLEVDDAAAADNQYARFTANGLEGRIESEFKADFNLELGTDVQAYDADTAKTDVAETLSANWVNTANPWAVNEGGTGAATFTDGGILLGSGTGAITALGAAANGQIPIGDGTTDPVLGTIAPNTDVDAITVANGAGTIKLSAHANVEAIADAETGVTDPAITMYDSSAAPGTADIFGTSTGAYDIIMSLWVDVAGTPTEYLQVDGVSETVDVLKPLIAAGIDAGPYFEVGVTSPKTIDSARCVQYFFSGASNKVYHLPAEPECHTIADTNEGYGKMFCFVSTGTGTMEINPDDSDYLFNPTTGAIMAQGESIINSTTPIAGDQVCFFGIDASDVHRWYPMQQSGDWVEETP